MAAFAVGFTSRRVGARAALTGTVLGHVISLLCFIAQQNGWLTWHFTILAGLLFITTVILIHLLQTLLRWPGPQPEQLAATAQQLQWRAVSPGIRYAACVVVVITALSVVAFW